MAIILVLAGLVLATSSYVHNKGARSRAEAEIAAMSAALENYKADNGVYPSDRSIRTRSIRTGSINLTDVTKTASLDCFTSSSPATRTTIGQPDQGKSYLHFQRQSADPANQGSVTFIKDPFGNSYGYSTRRDMAREIRNRLQSDLRSLEHWPASRPATDQRSGSRTGEVAQFLVIPTADARDLAGECAASQLSARRRLQRRRSLAVCAIGMTMR